MYQDEESVCAELAARSLTNKGRLFPDFYLRQNQSRMAAAPCLRSKVQRPRVRSLEQRERERAWVCLDPIKQVFLIFFTACVLGHLTYALKAQTGFTPV